MNLEGCGETPAKWIHLIKRISGQVARRGLFYKERWCRERAIGSANRACACCPPQDIKNLALESVRLVKPGALDLV